jgi:signal transduction histidine kinase
MTYGLVLSMLAALALVGINETSYRESTRALADIGEAQRMRGTLNALVQSVLDAETGQRGFLLTGDARYREPYDRAVAGISGQLAALRMLYANRPVEQERLSALSEHVSRKLSELDVSVRLRQSQNEEAWKFVLNTEVGREEMDTIRNQAQQLIVLSTQTLEAGQIKIAKALQFSRLGIALVALAGLGAFVLYLRQTQALRAAGERQQEALQRERNMLEVQVRERTASLAELATHLQDVRETERGYLARELHDELGSLLTAAKLDAARLKSRLADSPDAAQRLQHLTELLNSGIALKRRIIEDLRPSSLNNLGLTAALDILLREFGERAEIEITSRLEPVQLSASKQLTVYRLVQEALTNIGKYAKASRIDVALEMRAGRAMISVRDNGKGFDPNQLSSGSHGLLGMRYRIEAEGGRMNLTTAPGKGTLIEATLPGEAPGVAKEQAELATPGTALAA